jgi:hypothetical protein
MATWASPSETLAYTRISVSQDNLDAAQAMIELFADVVYNQTVDASGGALIGAKNLRLLKMATAYQAAWMTEHPDLFTHTDIQSINQDGIFYVHQHENSYLIAPMARRALRRLSWMRQRNIRIRPSSRRLVSKSFVDASERSGFQIMERGFTNTPEQDDNEDWGEL